MEKLLSTSDCGVWLALTQVPAAMRYFSALGGSEFSGASTVPSGSSVYPSSELESALFPVAVQVLVVELYSAVLMSSIEPSSTRPSGSTQHGASPMCVQPGVLIRCQASATGSYISARFQSSWMPLWYSPPATKTRPSASTAEA